MRCQFERMISRELKCRRQITFFILQKNQMIILESRVNPENINKLCNYMWEFITKIPVPKESLS